MPGPSNQEAKPESPTDRAETQRGTDAPRPSRRLALKLVAVVLGMSFALAAAEVGVRVLGIEPTLNVVAYENFRRSENPQLRYELVPGSPDGRRLKISSAGLRDREYSIAKPAGTFRIAMVGDSVTFGLGCPRAQTHPKFLERFLRALRTPEAPKFEVMNFGVTGYNAREIAATLRNRVAPFRPDLVVWAYVANDPQAFSMEMEAIESLERDSRAYLDRLRSIEVPRLIQNSRLAMLIWERTVHLPVTAPTRIDPVYAKHHRAAQIAYLSELHDEAGMKRIAAAMTQLARFDKGRSTNASDEAGPQAPPSNTETVLAIVPADVWLENGDHALAPVMNNVVTLARELGRTAIDLEPTIRNLGGENPSWLYDDILHPNPVGQKYVAASLFCELVERDLLRKKWWRDEVVDDSIATCAKHVIETVD